MSSIGKQSNNRGGEHGLIIAKRRIAAKTPYAPYVMRLILSCVVLDDKKLRAGDEMALKISICAGLSVFARLCSAFYGG